MLTMCCRCHCSCSKTFLGFSARASFSILIDSGASHGQSRLPSQMRASSATFTAAPLSRLGSAAAHVHTASPRAPLMSSTYSAGPHVARPPITPMPSLSSMTRSLPSAVLRHSMHSLRPIGMLMRTAAAPGPRQTTCTILIDPRLLTGLQVSTSEAQDCYPCSLLLLLILLPNGSICILAKRLS